MKNLKNLFVTGNLERTFEEKTEMDKVANEILANTEILELAKDIAVVDTSNEVSSRNLSIGDLLKGEAKEKYDASCTDKNFEKEDTTFIMGKYLPMDGVTVDVQDYTNSTGTMSLIVPHDQEKAREKMASINYMTLEEVKEIFEDVGYSHLPLDGNAVSGILQSKAGQGKSLSSILGIADGCLKREISTITTALSGGNVEHNDGGFVKIVFGQGAAYLTNFKDLHGPEATDMLVKHLEDLGYDDVIFVTGTLSKYFYSATFSSEKLGEEVLKEAGLEGTNPRAIMEFQTSDYGLSSLNLTPYLEFDIQVGPMRTLKKVLINLASMVLLNHNAATDEEEGITIKTLWSRKCEEVFAIIKDTSERLMESDKTVINYPENAMANLLNHVGANANFSGKEELLEEFSEECFDDCTARDLYVFANSILSSWETSNKAGALRAKDKLVRVLMNNGWKKLDII